MRIILPAHLFNTPNTKLELISLIQLGIDGRHLIQTDPVNAVEIEEWLAKLAELDIQACEACELALNSGFILDREEQDNGLSPLTIRITTPDNQPNWENQTPILPLNQATRQFLMQPLTLFLENRRNDSAFLKAVATGVRKTELNRLLQNNWIKFETGGGITEILEWVKEISTQPEHYWRSFALFDSDALKPGKPSQDSDALVQACDNRVFYHQLKRRAIENYLPLAALSVWMGINVHKKVNGFSRQKLVNAFAKLNPEQRHHYNMKNGFKGDFKDEQDELKKVGDFYHDLDVQFKKTLACGFNSRNENIAELFKEQDFKIQEQWLLQDGQQSEIAPMLDHIFSLV